MPSEPERTPLLSRPAHLALGLLALVSLGWAYASFAANRIVGYRTCIAEPTHYDGKELTFPLWTVTAVGGSDYEVGRLYRVPIDGAPAGLEVGDVVSVRGNFRAADGQVVESFRRLHPYRRWKQGLSAVGFIAALAFLPAAFRIQHGEIVERRLPDSDG